MKLAARFLTAMAIVSLAMIYVATRDQLPNAAAATGTIHALNVGTCYATDDDMFSKGDCDDGVVDAAYDVAGRTEIVGADPLYATYAVDPKTSSAGVPRAILYNSDLLKVSIKDDGRDKRTGVLYAVAQGTSQSSTDIQSRIDFIDTHPDAEDNKEVIQRAVGDDFEVALTSTDARFRVSGSSGPSHVMGGGGGLRTLRWSGTSDIMPIAPIHDETGHGMKLGRVRLFGFLQPVTGTAVYVPDTDDPDRPTDAFQDLSNRVELDEDYGCIPDPTRIDPDGTCRTSLPWFDAQFFLDTGRQITVMYVYYETSEQEEIVGGKKKADYLGYDKNDDGDTEDDDDYAPTIEGATAPVFVGRESELQPSNQVSLLASVSADGNKSPFNLWLKETGRFTGTYVGFVRLTDRNGNGTEAGGGDDAGSALTPNNWGRQMRDAVAPDGAVHTLPDPGDAAVIGVGDGPVVITYRDTDDDDQRLVIEIDIVQPTVTIDNPTDSFSTRDASPNMQGRFDDRESGLREESFKLFADNRDDGNEDGNEGTPVFDLKVYGTTPTHRGMVDEPRSPIDLAANYTGYSTTLKDSPFGIVKASEVYLPESGDASEYTRKVDGQDTSFDRRKVVDADDYDDGANGGEFDESIRFDFSPTLPDETFNNAIDFQAVVMDRAGNLGFSDSDPSSPRFIHEYGTKDGDREKDKHNVLGWYSRHILLLDLVDPEAREAESATGFFGREDGENTRNSSGVMVVFDKPVDKETITASTFEVTLDDGTDANVIAVDVVGKRVFLRLEEPLAADATPKVDLAQDGVIRDLAGNSTLPREFDEIELSDGILPTFTVTLDGGSGLGGPEPNYYGEDSSPDKMTKERITITITSDEQIQGAPKFAVLCKGFTWYNIKDMEGNHIEPDRLTEDQKATRMDQEETNGIAKYIDNRRGAMTTGDFGNAEPTAEMINSGRTNCRYEIVQGQPNPNPNRISETTALQRGSDLDRNRWQYQWSNIDGLRDGELTVVVTGRDIGGFREDSNALVNYGTHSAVFTLDTVLDPPTKDGGGEVIPDPDDAVSEPRPFVMIEFSEETKVKVTVFKLDDIDVLAEIEDLANNRFVYWPEPLGFKEYTVYVEANDAANNTTDFQYKFTVRDRLPFALNLLAGWNTISFPANPQDRALHAVFTAPEIDQVIGWDATNPDSPWRAATRVDGVWTTGEDYAVLNDVEARYGYWVHSQGFVTQSVKLVGKGDRIGPLFNETTDIPTNSRGWNFVGVVDVDGDQTEDNAQQTLLNSKKAPISAEQYLGDYRNAYTWNNIDNKWQRLRPDGPITIGTGIWVYYDRGGDIAP